MIVMPNGYDECDRNRLRNKKLTAYVAPTSLCNKQNLLM